MLRLTDMKLPLDHPEEAIAAAVLARLGIGAGDLLGYTVFRRGWDARKRSAIQLIYTLDVELADEAAVLARLAGDRNLGRTPDTGYKFVARAPERLAQRPIVIGAGP